MPEREAMLPDLTLLDRPDHSLLLCWWRYQCGQPLIRIDWTWTVHECRECQGRHAIAVTICLN